MKDELHYYGTVDDKGEPHLPGKKMREELKEHFTGKRVFVSIKEVVVGASKEQIGYYRVLAKWALPYFIQIDPIENSNLDAEDIHDMFKRRFLKPQIKKWIDPEGITIIKKKYTTVGLPKEDKSIFIEKIIKFCIDIFGVVPPPPTKKCNRCNERFPSDEIKMYSGHCEGCELVKCANCNKDVEFRELQVNQGICKTCDDGILFELEKP